MVIDLLHLENSVGIFLLQLVYGNGVILQHWCSPPTASTWRWVFSSYCLHMGLRYPLSLHMALVYSYSLQMEMRFFLKVLAFSYSLYMALVICYNIKVLPLQLAYGIGVVFYNLHMVLRFSCTACMLHW